ncbi:hypothetical protein ACGC1H_003289 [Rhizoctonia solani]
MPYSRKNLVLLKLQEIANDKNRPLPSSRGSAGGPQEALERTSGSADEEDFHVVTSSFLQEGSAADLWLYQVKKTSSLLAGCVPEDLPDVTPVVKKVMRVTPDYFRNFGTCRDEHLLLDLRKDFDERFQLWKSFSHPSIADLYFVTSTELTLFQEYCENGNLREYLKRSLSEIEHIVIIEDILKGVVYLHGRDPPIAHGYINPGKIFIGHAGRAKLGEFGLSQSVAGFPHLAPSITVAGMTRWMSPEYFNGSEAGLATIPGDLWSFGCTLLEMITGLIPYHQSRYDTQVLAKILSGVYPGNPELIRYPKGKEYPQEYVGLVQRLISQCWLPIGKRPSSQDLLTIEQLQVQVLDAHKRILGEEHPDTLCSMNNLASTYSDLGRYDEAEQLQVQVLDTRKRILGEEHPDTLCSMNNLASTYSDLGRYNEAEQLQVQELDVCKRILGEEHADTLCSMNNLASTYSHLGRYDKAEQLQVQVLNAHKRILGEEHPDTLRSIGNLALTYSHLGRYDEAEQLEVQVLNVRKRILGEEHPVTLRSVNNLASTYSHLGRYNEAEQLQVQVLDVRKRILGEEHPDTLCSMNNLASTYSHMGQYDKAEQLQVQVLDAHKRILGEEHPVTLRSVNNLAATYSHLGRYDKAEQLQVHVLNARERILGEEHPDTLCSMNNLASTYSDLGRYNEAEQLQVQVLNVRKRILGKEHPDTLRSMSNLASTYSDLGRWAEAGELYHNARSVAERTLGHQHPKTQIYRQNLAELQNCRTADNYAWETTTPTIAKASQ